MGFVARLGRGHRRPEADSAQRTEAETEHMPAIEVRHALILQLRFPIFAAFSASHHQMFGNPEAPYLGNGSG